MIDGTLRILVHHQNLLYGNWCILSQPLLRPTRLMSGCHCRDRAGSCHHSILPVGRSIGASSHTGRNTAHLLGHYSISGFSRDVHCCKTSTHTTCVKVVGHSTRTP